MRLEPVEGVRRVGVEGVAGVRRAGFAAEAEVQTRAVELLAEHDPAGDRRPRHQRHQLGHLGIAGVHDREQAVVQRRDPARAKLALEEQDVLPPVEIGVDERVARLAPGQRVEVRHELGAGPLDDRDLGRQQAAASAVAGNRPACATRAPRTRRATARATKIASSGTTISRCRRPMFTVTIVENASAASAASAAPEAPRAEGGAARAPEGRGQPRRPAAARNGSGDFSSRPTR